MSIGVNDYEHELLILMVNMLEVELVMDARYFWGSSHVVGRVARLASARKLEYLDPHARLPGHCLLCSWSGGTPCSLKRPRPIGVEPPQTR